MEKIKQAKQFFQEARQELKKVVWPTKDQTVASIRVVLIMVFIISIFLGLVDFILAKLVGYVLS